MSSRASRCFRLRQNRLVGEVVDEFDNVLVGNIVGPKDTFASTNAVFVSWCPVEVLHTTVTDKRVIGIRCGDIIVTGDDDGDSGVLLAVHTGELDDVHENIVHPLVGHGVLSNPTEPTGTGIDIVDEEAAHLALLDDISRLAIPLPDQFCGLTGVSTFQFSGAYHNGLDSHLGKDKFTLEKFALTFASPDTQNQRNPDVRHGHEVFGDVKYKLVHESRSDVETMHAVVQVASVLVGPLLLINFSDSL